MAYLFNNVTRCKKTYKKGFIRYLIKIIIFLIGTSLLGPSPVYAQQTIKFGLHQNKPLNFQDTDKQIKGLVIDVFTHIADRENWKVEYVPCAWGDCLDKLKNGDIDVLSAIGYTQQRSEIYDFASNTLINNWGLVVTQPGSKIQSLLDLDGKTIGVMKNAAHTIALQRILNEFNIHANFLVVDDFLSVLRLVHDHKSDVGVVNRLIALEYENEYHIVKSPIIFNPIDIRYAFTKNRHKETVRIVDRHLDKLKHSSNSIYFQAMDRWLSGTKPHLIPSWLKWLGIISLLLTGSLVILNTALNFKVKRKTLQLEKEISEHQSTAQALQKSKEKYESLFNHAEIGMYRTKLDGSDYLVVNDKFSEILGYSKKEFFDRKSIDDWTNPDDRDALLTQLHTDGAVKDYKVPFVMKTGKKRIGLVSARLFSEYGYIEGTILDITEQEKEAMEKKILQAEAIRAGHLASLGELAAGVAHEINNPVTGIITIAEIMTEEFSELGGDKTIPERIVREGKRISIIVKNLLYFARDQKEENSPAAIKDILKLSLDLVEKQIVKDGIQIYLDIPPSIPKIKANHQELQQVFLNILSNARYAINKKYPNPHENKLIEIKVQAIDITGKKHVRITFFDSGMGISNKIIENIMDPFFSTKPQGEGTGLGLSISHGIIKNHDGKFRFDSREGEYTNVIVDLPVWSD